MTNAPLLVRQASSVDAAAISAVHAESWPHGSVESYEPEFLVKVLAHRTSEQVWTERLADPAFVSMTVLIAERDGHPVGIAQISSDEDDASTGVIHRFYVVPAEFGNGVSQALMAIALQQFSEQGSVNASVWTGTHPRARRFYEKSGFSLSGRTRQHQMVDDVYFTEYEYRQALQT